MVHRCIMCYSASNIHKDVSFHRFPKDETRRAIWMDALSINGVVKDWHRICSLHFSRDHFTFSNERKILKLDAIPILKEVKDEVGSCETSLEHDMSNSFIDVDWCTEDNGIEVQIVTHEDSTNESPPSTSKRSLDFGHKNQVCVCVSDREDGGQTRNPSRVTIVTDYIDNPVGGKKSGLYFKDGERGAELQIRN